MYTPSKHTPLKHTHRSWPRQLLCGWLLASSFAWQAHADTIGSGVTLQAENFVAMSGIQTETTTDVGGGLNVGWFDANDWLAYPLTVEQTAVYKVTFRVASPNATGVIKLEPRGGGAAYGTLAVPNTGGWQNWASISGNFNLPVGSVGLGVVATVGGFNLN